MLKVMPRLHGFESFEVTQKAIPFSKCGIEEKKWQVTAKASDSYYYLICETTEEIQAWNIKAALELLKETEIKEEKEENSNSPVIKHTISFCDCPIHEEKNGNIIIVHVQDCPRT